MAVAVAAQVWDVRTATCTKLFSGAEGILYCAAWSCDGRLLAASNNTGGVHLYDYARNMLVKTLQLHGPKALVLRCARLPVQKP